MATGAPTEKELADFVTENASRLKHDRESRRLKDKWSPFVARTIEYVKNNGGNDRTLIRSGFICAVTEKRGIPQYKEAYLQIADADAAAELQDNPPMYDQLSITPVKK